jgi:hypothetical protein
MQSVEMEIRRVEVVRQHHINGHWIRIWWQVVDQVDAEDVTGLHAKHRAGDCSLIRTQVRAPGNGAGSGSA